MLFKNKCLRLRYLFSDVLNVFVSINLIKIHPYNEFKPTIFQHSNEHWCISLKS